MNMLALEFDSSEGGKKQTLTLHGVGQKSVRVDMWSETPLDDQITMDGALCGVIFYAMRHCRKLKVNGQLSERFFRNIAQYQEAWHCHFPKLYQPVEIEPTKILPSADPVFREVGKSSIQAFSGGIDSMFTLLRGRSACSVESSIGHHCGLIVHGFDVPASNQSDFAKLRKRVEKITDLANVELKVLRTSVRDTLKSDWNHSHGAALACVLQLQSRGARLGMIPSSDPYNYVSFVPHAWGSSPATDHLLSGDEMEIIHDGAGFSRPRKVAYLAEHFGDGLRLAQFCWQGKDRAANCGQCDKCIQTLLALRVINQEKAVVFQTEMGPNSINRLKISDETLGDLLPLLELAESQKYDEPWVSTIRERIAPFLPVKYGSNRSKGRALRYFKAALREL